MAAPPLFTNAVPTFQLSYSIRLVSALAMPSSMADDDRQSFEQLSDNKMDVLGDWSGGLGTVLNACCSPDSARRHRPEHPVSPQIGL